MTIHSDEAELVPITSVQMEFSGLGEFTMMIFEVDGFKYITFAEVVDEACLPAPFPDHLIDCRTSFEQVRENLLDMGYILDWSEEQMRKRQ